MKARRREGIRDKARAAALDLLGSLEKLRGLEKNLLRPRIQFLYLHHVFPDEERALRRLLEFLSEYHTFISHSEAVDRILSGEIERPYVSFSLDDGFRNNLRAGEVFGEYGVSACFFVIPELVGTTDFERVRRICRERLSLPPIAFMNWEEIRRLRRMGHEIGSHTLSHRNLAELPAKKAEQEIRESRRILSRELGEEVAHFAFPYGRFRHFSEAAREAVYDAGYRSCSSAEKGAHVNPETPLQPRQLCIRRNQVKLDWDFDHILYFIGRGARRADPSNNHYPPA